jgi:hypothetical protein
MARWKCVYGNNNGNSSVILYVQAKTEEEAANLGVEALSELVLDTTDWSEEEIEEQD